MIMKMSPSHVLCEEIPDEELLRLTENDEFLNRANDALLKMILIRLSDSPELTPETNRIRLLMEKIESEILFRLRIAV